MRAFLTLSFAVAVLGLLSAANVHGVAQDNKARATGTVHSVKMTAGNKFDPADIKIKVGDQVKWINEGGTHTATADDQTDLKKSFNTGTVKKGQEVTIAFNNEGTIAYHCEYHGGMKGKITVEK